MKQLILIPILTFFCFHMYDMYFDIKTNKKCQCNCLMFTLTKRATLQKKGKNVEKIGRFRIHVGSLNIRGAAVSKTGKNKEE